MFKPILTALVASALSSYVFADTDRPTQNETEASESSQAENKASDPQAEPGFSSGMIYYRDPETGELSMPPPEVMRAMQIDELNFSDRGLRVQILPDGSKMIDLQGRFKMSSTVKVGPNGPVHHCTDQPHTHLVTSNDVQASSVREDR